MEGPVLWGVHTGGQTKEAHPQRGGTNRHAVAPTLTDRRERTRHIAPVSCSSSSEHSYGPPLGLCYWRLFFSVCFHFLFIYLFICQWGGQDCDSVCKRGVEGYNWEQRGRIVAPSYDLEVKTSALGGPLSELLGALSADFNKNTKKNSPIRAPGWTADANVKDSVFSESFSTPHQAHCTTWQLQEAPPLPPLLWLIYHDMKENSNKSTEWPIIIFSQMQFHTVISLTDTPSYFSSLFHSSFYFLLSLCSCHDKCQTFSKEEFFCFFFSW